MERLDFWTDPFEAGPLDSGGKINLSLGSDALPKTGKITLRTVPMSDMPGSINKVVPRREPSYRDGSTMDWEFLSHILDEASVKNRCAEPAEPGNAKGSITVKIIPNNLNRHPPSQVPSTVLKAKGNYGRGSVRQTDPLDEYNDFIRGVLENREPIETDESDEEYVGGNGLNSKGAEEEEEYISDRTVQISMKELLDLFEDEYFVNGKNISVDRLRKRLETLDSEKSGKVGFSNDLLAKLDCQVCQHIQLVVQNVALSSELVGAEELVTNGICLLSHVRAALGMTLSYKAELSQSAPVDIHSKPSCDMPSLDTNIQEASDDGNLTATVQFPSTRLEGMEAKLSILEQAYTHVTQVTGKELNPRASVKRASYELRNTAVQENSGEARGKLVGRPEGKRGSQFYSDSYYTWLALFQDYFAGEHCISVEKAELAELVSNAGTHNGDRSERFMEAEDKLLLIGLRKFGVGSWESIQAQLLPTRSAKQLQVRFKNMSSRRAPDNPLKNFNNELLKPLSRVEEEFLYRGVQRFGKDFERISRHYLPHRPVPVLRKLWEAMDEARRLIRKP